MSAKLLALFSIRWVRIATRAPLTVLGALMSSVFIGFVLPVFIVYLGLLSDVPSLGSLAYGDMYIGWLIGLIAGWITFWPSLVRRDRLIVPYYAHAVASMSVVFVFFVLFTVHNHRFMSF